MVINKRFDLEELLAQRIEAIEDLNCEELYECIKSFLFAAWYLQMLENMNDDARYTSLRNDICYKNHFYSVRDTAQEYIDKIDELTLKTDTAE